MRDVKKAVHKRLNKPKGASSVTEERVEMATQRSEFGITSSAGSMGMSWLAFWMHLAPALGEGRREHRDLRVLKNDS